VDHGKIGRLTIAIPDVGWWAQPYSAYGPWQIRAGKTKGSIVARLRTSANLTFGHCGEQALVELVQKAATVAMLAFVLSSMLAMGLGLTIGEIVAPLRNGRLVVLSLLANFVLMPLGAVALAKSLRLDEPLGVGLLLLGSAAGAPFLPKLAQMAKGNLAFAVGSMVLLMVVTVGYLPLVLPLLLPGISVNPAKIARSLFLLMLLPLAGALAVKARFAVAAARTKPVLDQLSSLSLILLAVLITVANVNNVLSVFGTRGILAGLLFIAIGLGMGWLLGGSDTGTRRVVALGTAQRNMAAALVVGSQSFSDPKVVVMVVVVAIVGLLVLIPLSRMLARG
jgi:BASS family bile acid:Na+ symporter